MFGQLSNFQTNGSLIAHQTDDMVFELTVVSSYDTDRKVSLEMTFFKWDSFDAISTKIIKNLIVNGNQATVIYRDNIVNLLNSNNCPYGHLEECYVVFEVTGGDHKGMDRTGLS